MQDPAYLKYVEYFKKQPMTQQYYYRVGIEKTITAKELSNKMGRSIQTVTNALRDLERVGLLKSEKKGRVRTYALKDPRLFKGLTSARYYPGGSIKEDIISTDFFSQNMEMWLKYGAQVVEGTLYVNQKFRTHVIDPIKVDFVIENQIGQTLIMFVNSNSPIEVEATVGKVLSLILAEDLNPNLRTIFAIWIVNENSLPAAGDKLATETDFRNLVAKTMSGLEKAVEKYHVWLTYLIQFVKPEEFAKKDFAEKLSNTIISAMPYGSVEALPGEIWEFGDVRSRRTRAFKAIQDKINPKCWRIFPSLRELLPRDAELKRLLYPESLLLSLGLKAGDVFVDVGCFEGLFTIPAAKIVGDSGKVYGVEFSSIALEKLKSSLAQDNLSNVTLKNDFPEKVVIESQIADVVFFGTALYDMYNPIMSLKNAHKILKDSGRLVILEWKSRDPNEKPTRNLIDDVGAGPTMQARLDRELVITFIEAAGFKIQEKREEGFYLYLIVATKK